MMKWLIPLAAIVLGACGDPSFVSGQMVQMKVSGARGMVVRVQCTLRIPCRYNVRFSALQLRTDSRLLGRDGPIEFAPVALVRGIRDFELKAVK